MVDGGDGSLNPVYDDLQHYHLEACRAARPEPVKLAARLLHYELEGGLGVFNNAAKAYADIRLGPRGLAAWRSELVREWSALPELGPPPASGHPGEHQPINHRRFQIQALMERMAEAGGDLATMAAVKQRDLSSVHDFLSLAELYQQAGQDRSSSALGGTGGCSLFPGLPDRVGLRDFLAAAYHQLGRHEEATAIVWAEFEYLENLEHYRKLEKHARQGPGDDWPRWRAKAIEQLRAQPRVGGRAAGSNPLVEIFLAESADDEAWTEAVTNGCQTDLWLVLAERREKTFPADALRVYQERLGLILARGGPNANEEAATLLRRMQTLFERLGRSADFARYRTEVRAAHRAKRGFLKLTDAPGA